MLPAQAPADGWWSQLQLTTNKPKTREERREERGERREERSEKTEERPKEAARGPQMEPQEVHKEGGMAQKRVGP